MQEEARNKQQKRKGWGNSFVLLSSSRCFVVIFHVVRVAAAAVVVVGGAENERKEKRPVEQFCLCLFNATFCVCVCVCVHYSSSFSIQQWNNTTAATAVPSPPQSQSVRQSVPLGSQLDSTRLGLKKKRKIVRTHGTMRDYVYVITIIIIT